MAAQETPPTPASVSGVVLNSVTGEPIVRAHVRLQELERTVGRGGGSRGQVLSYGSGSQQNYGALTNAEGKFTIEAVPPGTYSVAVERVGYVPVDSSSVTLASGDKKDNLKLSLAPGGVITGRVLNPEGAPVADVMVRAQGSRGDRQVTTDERGRYRIGALAAGKYRVRAAVPQQFGEEIRTDGTRQKQYANTYYPNSRMRAAAGVIDVQPGGQVSGVDIRLMQAGALSVSGKVTGIPSGRRQVMVWAASTAGFENDGARQTTVKTDGTFKIGNLDPGKYRLGAMAVSTQQESSMTAAPLELEISGADIEHLELTIIPPFTVTGVIRFDDAQVRTRQTGQQSPGSSAEIPVEPRRIQLQGQDFVFGAGLSAAVGDDDSFTLQNVTAGRHHLVLSGMTGYIRSVRTGSRELEGDLLDVSNGDVGPIVVSVGSQAGEVSGTVRDASGTVAKAHVVVVPEGGERALVLSAVSNADGVFQFKGVPPGKYRLAVTDTDFYPRPMGPDPLEDYKDTAESITVQAGGKVTKDLQQK